MFKELPGKLSVLDIYRNKPDRIGPLRHDSSATKLKFAPYYRGVCGVDRFLRVRRSRTSAGERPAGRSTCASPHTDSEQEYNH
jgi:hypothetical protein